MLERRTFVDVSGWWVIRCAATLKFLFVSRRIGKKATPTNAADTLSKMKQGRRTLDLRQTTFLRDSSFEVMLSKSIHIQKILDHLTNLIF